MIQFLQRWLSFDAQNLISEVWFALALLWIALVAFSLTSIAGLDTTFGSKFFWTLLVICLPLVGLFAYCVRCLIFAEYNFLEFLSFRNRKARAATRNPQPQSR